MGDTPFRWDISDGSLGKLFMLGAETGIASWRGLMASNEPLWYGHDPPVQGGPLTSYKYRLTTLFRGEITPVTHWFLAIYRGDNSIYNWIVGAHLLSINPGPTFAAFAAVRWQPTVLHLAIMADEPLHIARAKL